MAKKRKSGRPKTATGTKRKAVTPKKSVRPRTGAAKKGSTKPLKLTEPQKRALESVRKTRKILQQRIRRVSKQGYDVNIIVPSMQEFKEFAQNEGVWALRRKEKELRALTPTKIRTQSKAKSQIISMMKSAKFQTERQEQDDMYFDRLHNDKEEIKMATFTKMSIDNFRADINNTIMKTSYWQLGNEIITAIDNSLYETNGEEKTAQIISGLVQIRDEYFLDLNKFYKHTEEEIVNACEEIISKLQGGISEEQKSYLQSISDYTEDTGEDYADGIPDTQMYTPQDATYEARRALNKALYEGYESGELQTLYSIALYTSDEREILENISSRLPDFQRNVDKLGKTEGSTHERIRENIMEIMLGRT